MTREVAFQVIMTEVCSILFFFFFEKQTHTREVCSVDEDEQIPRPFQYELSIFFFVC